MIYKKHTLQILKDHDDRLWAEPKLKEIDRLLHKFEIGTFTEVSRENYIENRGIMSTVASDSIGHALIYYNIMTVYILKDKYYGHMYESIADMDIYPHDNLVYNMKQDCFEPNKYLRDKFFEMYKMGMLN